MKESPRPLDFVSIVEVFRNPVVGWFYGHMNAFPLDRGRVDTATTRIILERLKQGRVVAMFPEGGIRSEADSVLSGGRFKPGVLRLARLAGVPIVPAVILGTGAYRKPAAWLPLRRTRYAVNFGLPIEPVAADEHNDLEAKLRSAFQSLHAELKDVLSHP